MNILIHNRHQPYSFDLLRGLVGHFGLVAHIGWWNEFRPVPDGVAIISEENAMSGSWDVLITDESSVDWLRRIRCLKIIHIAHNEHFADIGNDDWQLIEMANKIVTPSASKLTTWRQAACSKFESIPLAVSGDDYPERRVSDTAIVGTVWNSMTATHVADDWKALSDGFDAVAIGHGNADVTCSKIVAPCNWDDYRRELSKIDIFVHVMRGNVTGMSPREAMATGIPVISIATPELMVFAFNWWDCVLVFPGPRRIEMMRQAIQRLIDDPSMSNRMGAEGRKSILRNYPLSKFQQRWRDVIKEVAL